jgi:hypothetical protein
MTKPIDIIDLRELADDIEKLNNEPTNQGGVTDRMYLRTRYVPSRLRETADEIERLRGALSQLVRAKLEKEANGETARYHQLKEGAWERASAVLGTSVERRAQNDTPCAVQRVVMSWFP